MMVALEGQHRGLDTNAFSNCIPCAPNRVRVLGMYLRSSLRMSSVRMKTKLGLTGVVWTAVGGLPVMTEKNSTANAVEANSTARKALIRKLTLLIPVHPSFEDALGFGVEVIIKIGRASCRERV